MIYQYLLDTNIVSELIKHPNGKIFQQIASVGEQKVCTSIIVACELRFGALKRNSNRLTQQLETILNILPILPLADAVDQTYAEIRAYLEASGTPIGPNDLLIASHALVLNLTLVTANVREFSRVPDLRISNWLE